MVGEDDVAEAMVLLLERARLVVEGAGAVGVAALVVRPSASGGARARPASSSPAATSTTDLLAGVARRHETQAGRRLVLFSRVARPAGRARPAADARRRARCEPPGGEHLREGVDLHVRETGVQLVLETRGRDHANDVVDRLRAAGYDAIVVR